MNKVLLEEVSKTNDSTDFKLKIYRFMIKEELNV
jgi:hypothetical protein